MRVSEIEALHCLAMMQHISHSDLTLYLAIPPPRAPPTAAAAPGLIYSLDLHVDLLCFYATLVLFPLYAMCLSYLLPSGAAASSCAAPPSSSSSWYAFGLVTHRFYCMFYGNFQTLDALCTSNAFNAFHAQNVG